MGGLLHRGSESNSCAGDQASVSGVSVVALKQLQQTKSTAANMASPEQSRTVTKTQTRLMMRHYSVLSRAKIC